jgi:hypothetical protein
MRVGENKSLNYANPATVDVADFGNDRIAVNRQGRYVSMPDLDFELAVPGGLSTASTASGLVIRHPRALKIVSVWATVGTVPAGAPIILDVHKIAAGGAATDAGTTIFTTQSRRPTIPATMTAEDEVQTLDATGTVDGGQYKLSFDGETTADIAYDANAAAIQAALEALPNVAAGDIVVAGGDLPGDPVTFTFGEDYAGMDVPLITVEEGTTPLTGGGSYDVVETTPGVSAATSLGVSTLSATAGVPEVTALAAGDLLRVEIDQVGSDTAGSDLRVHIRCEPA